MRELIPVNGKIVVKLKVIETKMIYLTADAKKELNNAEGYIVAIADDCDEIYKVGDLVVYGKYAALEVLGEEEKDLYIVDEGSIIYKIKENKENK